MSTCFPDEQIPIENEKKIMVYSTSDEEEKLLLELREALERFRIECVMD